MGVVVVLAVVVVMELWVTTVLQVAEVVEGEVAVVMGLVEITG
jgi:hypothetical protein